MWTYVGLPWASGTLLLGLAGFRWRQIRRLRGGFVPSLAMAGSFGLAFLFASFVLFALSQR
jgi:hypothetical protein